MRPLIVIMLFAGFLAPSLSQGNPPAGDGTRSKEPHEILAAAAPLYDFNSSELKPWHLRVAYQIYDWNGQHVEEGTWDYWQLSAEVNRATWTRLGSNHTVWRTTGGAVYRKDSGSPLKYFEKSIATNFLNPLSRLMLENLSKVKLEVKMLPPGKPELECVVDDSARPMPSYFCFDPITPVLRMTVFDGMTTLFHQIVETQGRYLGHQMEVSANKRKLFTASVEIIDPVDPSDAVFKPSADAILQIPPRGGSSGDLRITPPTLLKKVPPDYPASSKSEREQGVVALGIVVGANGKVEDVEVLSAPSPMLAAAASDAVKNWEYKPPLQNGVPIEFSLIVHVVFGLGS